MKYAILILTVALMASCGVAKVGPNVNSNGYIAQGYDVTEYFNDKPTEGFDRYSTTYDGAKYKFANQQNLDTFNANPQKYQPTYDGWCAYGVGASNKKIGINPETYEIRDGKLYLFYNSWGINTLKSWLEEDPKKLQAKADVNWNKIKLKK